MNESRAILLNKEWHKVEKCYDCASYHGFVNKGVCGKFCYYIWFLRNGINTDSDICRIANGTIILDSCPLPLWDDVRLMKITLFCHGNT